MAPLIGIVLFGVFLGVVIWLGRKQHHRALANLEALAQRHGLRLVSSRSMLSSRHVVAGDMRGRTVRFWSFTTGSGKSRQYWVAVGVQPRRVGAFTFRIEPQGMAARLAELFGAKEIQVGDPRFDDAWFIRTSHPTELAAGLLPEIREKLMAARAAGAKGEFKCEDGFVCYVQQGNFSKDETVALLEAQLSVLSDLADVAEVCAAG